MTAAMRIEWRRWAAAAACSVAGLAWAQPAPVTMPAEKVKPEPAAVPSGSPGAPVPATVPVDSTGTPMPATAPPPGTPGGDGGPLVRTDMRHKCGGIGSDESDAMRAQMKDHPLALLMAKEGGAYLADIDVTIQGGGSKPAMVFRASGPVCLIDLPPGTYQVQASKGGVTRRESVTLGSGAKTVNFRFP